MQVKVGNNGIYGVTDPQEIAYMLEMLEYGEAAVLRPGVYRVEHMGISLPQVTAVGNLFSKITERMGWRR